MSTAILYPPFYWLPEQWGQSRLGDKLIVIVQAEIGLLRRHCLGGGAVWHQPRGSASGRPTSLISTWQASIIGGRFATAAVGAL